MGKQSNALRRSSILRQMCALAGARFNDAVRLAYLTQEQAGEIGSLDLTALKEFKRGANGAVEIKLTDRAEVLEKVLQLLDSGEDGKAQSFLKALQAQGEEGG